MTLEKLKTMVGQRIKVSETNEVYDTYIILTDLEENDNNEKTGILRFLGKELTEESDKIIFDKNNKNLCPIYNDKAYIEGEFDIIG